MEVPYASPEPTPDASGASLTPPGVTAAGPAEAGATAMQNASPGPTADAEAPPEVVVAGASDATASPVPSDADLDLRLVEADGSDAFDQLVAAQACAPGGPGFVQARVLRWDARIEAFQVSAQVGGPTGFRVLMHVIAPETIGAFADQAWRSGVPGHGEAPAPLGSTSWFGAVPFGRGSVALLIGRWVSQPPDADARLRAWCDRLRVACVARERRLAAARAERRVSALRDLSAMLVTSNHLSEVVHSAARLAVTATDADGAGVWIAGPNGAARLEVCFGPSSMRDRSARTMSLTADRVQRDGVVVRGVEGAATLGAPADEIQDAFTAPLGARSPAAGALAVWRELRRVDAELPPLAEAGPFIEAVADTVAAALDRAHDLSHRREAELRASDAERESTRLARQAGYGSLAESAREEAHAAAAAVRVLAARLRDSMAEQDLTNDYAEALAREAERLDRALLAQDACGAEEPSDRTLVSINDLVNDALRGLGDRLVRRRVRLLKRLSAEVPKLVLDERRVGQAVTQLLAVAMDSISVGGRVRVESRRLPHHVVLHVSHDGTHTPGDALEQLFVPFTSGPGGPPIALGVADRIVHEHGGELRVRAEGEWSTVVDLALPIRDLQDRRSPSEDRRARKDRRLRAFKETPGVRSSS